MGQRKKQRKTIATSGSLAMLRSIPMASLVGLSLVMGNLPDVVQAQGAAASSAPIQQVKRFDIPAGTLDAALSRFGQQSGLLVSVDAALTKGLTSKGLTGEYPPRQALDLLLTDSGLMHRFLDERTVSIGVATLNQSSPLTLSPIEVTGLRNPTVRVGLFGEKDRLNIPFSVESFSEEQIELVQSRTAKEILELDPSVRSTTTSRLAGENYIIRGINLFTSEIFVDGLPGLVPGRRNSVASFDRLELFKGPSTLLNGPPPFGNSAGLINLVPKRAGPEAFFHTSVDYESSALLGTNLDANYVDGDWGFRGYTTVRHGDTEFDDNTFSESTIGGSIQHLGTRLQGGLDVFHQRQELEGALPLIFPGGTRLPSAPDSRSNPFGDDLTYEHETTTVLANISYQPNEQLNLYTKLGYHRGSDEQLGGLFFITGDNGDGDAEPFLDFGESKNFAYQVGADVNFTTGPIEHSLSVRGDVLNATTEFGGGTAPAAVASNLYDPVPTNFVNPGFGPVVGKFERDFQGVSVSDSLGLFDNRLVVNVGARWQRFELSPPGAQRDIDETDITPSVSAVFKLSGNWSVYGSYIEGLGSPTLTTTGAANGNEVLPPPETEQIEVGTKYRGSWLSASAALFDTRVPNRYLDSVTNIDDFNGENVYRGLELIVDAQPIDGLRLNGGVTLLDAEQRDTAGGLQDGFRPQASPEISASLFAEYDITNNVSLITRIVHTGRSFVDAGERFEVPSSTRLDLGSRYEFLAGGQALTASLMVDNVTDSNDWLIGRNFVSTIQPRTFRVTVSAEF